MDELFALFSSDIDDEGEGGPVGYGHEGVVDVGEEDREEGQDQDEGDIGIDLRESRPVKRSRSGAAVSPPAAVAFGAGDDSSSSGDLRSRGRGGSEAMDEEEEQEVIEILSDDDDAQPLARRSRQAGHGLVDREDATQARESAFAGGAIGAAGASFKLSSYSSGSSSSIIRGRRGGLKGYHASPTSGSKRELGAMAGGGATAQKPAAAAAARVAAAPLAADASAGVFPRFNSVGGGGRQEDGEGKPSAEQNGAPASAAAGRDAGGSGWLGGLVAAAKAATLKINSKEDNLDDSKSGQIGSTLGASGDFPLNLECAMCFNPVAVTALFACGHGSCWECAHDWCSRVSVPLKCFRGWLPVPIVRPVC